MQLGLRLPHFGPVASADVIRRAAEIAEADGWHSVWTSDRVAMPAHRPGPLAFLDSYVQTYESLLTLTFVASATSRVLLGTSAIVLPQRQLMLLARQAATLDALSGGRLVLGLAAGWAAEEFDAAGAGDRFAARGIVLDEAIAALRLLWSGEPVQFHGEWIEFPAVELQPHRADIPILIAGNSAPARRRAARVGDGWNPTALGAADTAAGLIEIDRLRGEYGRTGRFLSVGSLRVDPEPGRARATLQPYAHLGVDIMICAFTTSDADDFLTQVRSFGRQVVSHFHALGEV